MANGGFVSYLRVSTVRQGVSGLGLEAQRESVATYLASVGGTLRHEVIEVESGKRCDRPALASALSLCRLHRATLVVGKLDRLARNVAFIANLLEAGTDFVAADLPQANRLTIHLIAAFAEYEAALISTRTKGALAAAKARGVTLGGVRGDSARMRVMAAVGNVASAAARTGKAAKRRDDLLPIIERLKADGAVSLRQLARALNENQVPTARGSAWSAEQVRRVVAESTCSGQPT